MESNINKIHHWEILDNRGHPTVEVDVTLEDDRLVFPVSNSQIRTIIHEVDRDGDGQITYYEYLGAIAHVGLQ
jgi:enolase